MKSFFKLREELDSCCDECADDTLYGSVEEDFEPTGDEQYEDWDEINEGGPGLWANIHAKRQRIKAGSGERMREPGSKGAPTASALKRAAESYEDLDEAKDSDQYTYIDQTKGPVLKGKTGTYVGYTHSATKGKGANILKHNKTKKYYAAGGSSTAFTAKTTLHDTPEAAAKAYHDKRNEKLAEDFELDEAAFAPTMRKAIAAHERGDHKMAKYHLDNAKTARYALKSTDIAKHKDLLDKYKELRAMHEDVKGVAEEASPMIKPPKNEFGTKADAFAHAKKHGGKVMKKTFTHPTTGMKNVSYVVKEDVELDEAKYQKLSAHDKFKNSMKRAGYDMDAGAKRLQDLLAKQKKEREEREKQGVAEGIELQEAEKGGRKVQLNKPFRTSDGKGKFAVYTKNEKGNVVKVNFGDTTGLTIKTGNPDRRRNFRARHNCDNPGPKHKARFWACKSWSKDTVSAGLGT
jgi:hypothetical protein